MPSITITTPADGPQRYEISANRETVTLGRSSKSDIKVACESVSGQHATIRKLDDGYVLRDLGSTNGTKLDGKKVSEIHLKRSLKIHLGDVALDFVPDGESAEPTASDDRTKTSKADDARTAEHQSEAESNPVVLGLSLMGAGLIVLGFVVLLGMDSIKAIAERGQGFILGGGALILVGILTLASILFVTGRVKIPKLVVRFDDDGEEDDKPKKKKNKDRDDEDDADDESDDDNDAGSGDENSDESDENEEVGRAPKSEEDEDEKK